MPTMYRNLLGRSLLASLSTIVLLTTNANSNIIRPEIADQTWFETLMQDDKSYEPGKKYEFFNARECKYYHHIYPEYRTYSCVIDYDISTALGTRTCIDRMIWYRNPLRDDVNPWVSVIVSRYLAFQHDDYNESKSCGSWTKSTSINEIQKSNQAEEGFNESKNSINDAVEYRDLAIVLILGLLLGALMPSIFSRRNKK